MSAQLSLPLALGCLLLAGAAHAAEGDISGYIIAPEGEESAAGSAVYACPLRPHGPAGAGCQVIAITADTLFAPYLFTGVPDGEYYVYAIRDSNGSGDIESGEFGAIYAGLLDTYEKRATMVRPPRSNVTVRLRQYTGEAASLYPGRAADGFTFENAALPVRTDQMTGTWEGGEYRGELNNSSDTGSQSQYGSNRFVFGDDGRYTSSDIYHQLGECKVYSSSGTYQFTADLLRLTLEESGLGDCGEAPTMTPVSGGGTEELAWRLMYYAGSGLFLELIAPDRLRDQNDWQYSKSYARAIP